MIWQQSKSLPITGNGKLGIRMKPSKLAFAVAGYHCWWNSVLDA
jgi:hypothetical protein